MKYQISDLPLLKKILWADSLLGGVTAVAGLLWRSVIAEFLGLPANVFLVITGVTLVYALTALSLALQASPYILLLRVLIYANWMWTVISLGLLIVYSPGATVFGVIFLILQVLVVGGLAYLEGRRVYKADERGAV